MRDVLVLCYHAVSDRWPDELAIRPAALQRQLEYLLARGYVPSTFTEAVLDPPSQRVLAVTFDDAYRSVFEQGRPVLDRLGIPATVFVPSGHVDTGEPMAWPGIDRWLDTDYRDELVGASWEQVRAVADSGWEIGSHTVSHPRLTEVDDTSLAEELSRSREEIERRLGRPCASIAYPYGEADRRVVAAAGHAGYQAAAGLPMGRFSFRPERLLWPRLMIGGRYSEGAFRRHTSPLSRRLRATPMWTMAVRVLPRIRAGRDVAAFPLGSRPELSPALRLIASDGRVVRRRPAVLAGGALVRMGFIDGFVVWPDATFPKLIVGADHVEAAKWLLRTFEPWARPVARIAPAAWNMIRARSLVLAADGQMPGLATVRRALGRDPTRPRIALYSPHGDPLSKATCFLFEGDAQEPTAVIKAVPEPSRAALLRHEVEVVEQIRDRLGEASVADALPLPPLAVDDGGDYQVVQAVDPLAAFTGRRGDDLAIPWLREFHAATEADVAPWGSDDREAALRAVDFGWSHAHPGERSRVVQAVGRLLDSLDGLPAPVCVSHGDFWRGNVASDGDRLRIYDWEWADLAQRPFRDIWSHELAELREISTTASDAELRARCTASLDVVEAELEARGLDRSFARATLIPNLAWLSFRFRARTGEPGGNEPGAGRVMTVVDELLLGGSR